MESGERKIALAAVAGAHGVKGEVRLKLFTDNVDSLRRHRSLRVGSSQRRLLAIRQSGKTIIAGIEGVSDRSAAEALRGELVEINRSDLPRLGEDEYYHADLIGLAAFDRGGKPVGSIIAVENYGAGDLLEIEDLAGRKSLIPFRAGIADLEDGRIVLDSEFLV
jgi:16S rRNA processing protein RimM